MRSLFGWRSRSSNAPGERRRRRTPTRASAGIEPLEQRRLLAADSGREVVLIDSALVASIPQEELAGSLVVSIDAGRDAVAQISTALAGLSDLDVVRVISHGSDGTLWFGDQRIDAATLTTRAEEIAGWRRSLSADGDILLYGCSVASTDAGQRFVQFLAELTSADVAASSNLTGVGGDETLEFRVGDVTAGLLAAAADYERAEMSLEAYTINQQITSWTNNMDGKATIRMSFDLRGQFYYAGGFLSDTGWVYMYVNGQEVASSYMTAGNGKTIAATVPLRLGNNEISVSARRGFPTTWQEPDPINLPIQAPYYLGMPSTLTVPVGQWQNQMYVVSNAFGTPTIRYSATNLPRGVTIDSRGVILGIPETGTAGVYNVVLQATNGFATATHTMTVTVTNQAPSFAGTTPATVSGATEGTPFTITYAALAAALDESDPNNDPLSFRIESLLGGTLTKNGSPVTAGSTLLGPGESLVWTPPPTVNGTLDAFTVKASDGATLSATAKTVRVSVGAVNDRPTFSQFSGPVASGNEDAAIPVSLAALLGSGDEADIDGSVTAFVVKAVTTGTLRIGTSDATATAWNATTNAAITSSLNAYWTPEANVTGAQSAFTAVARDDGGLESLTPAQAVVTVNPVNDSPTLTNVAIISGAAASDPFEISYAMLSNAANAADIDGDAIGFRIEAVSSGSLDKWTGSAWAAVIPGTTLVAAGDKVRWIPVAGSSGLRNAFTVKAWDGQLASATAIQVQADGDRWRVLPWTDAASSSVSPSYRYTHAYSFGAAGNFAVNGVTFTGIAGGNPAVAGRLTTMGFATVATGDANNLADATRSLGNDAIASSTTAPTVTLRGLTPGGRYVLSLFTVGVDSGSRIATLSSTLGQVTVNQNEYGNNNGVRVEYTYLADASGSVTITLAVPGSSFSLYGLANREFGAAIRLDAPTSLTYSAAPKPFQATVLNYATASNSPFVSSGVGHTVLLKTDGTVTAFGFNDYGQANVPAGLTDVVAVSAGGYHTLALKSDGTVVAWGSTSGGEASVPVGLTNVVAISAGRLHSLALKADGTVVAWGSNTGGQTSVPAGLTGIVAISAGADHSMALKADGTVVAWGYGWYNFATPPAGLTDVVAISAGDLHSLALKSNGTVVAWGNNASFQSQVPAGLNGVVAISAGTTRSVALKSDGTVVSWGDRDGYTLNSLPSGMPPGLSEVVAIDTGSYQTVALKSDGTIASWGHADPFGQRFIPTSALTAQPPTVGLAGRLLTLENPSFTYTYRGRESTVYVSSSTPPTSAGDYTVTVTSAAAGNAFSVSQNFTIARVTPSLTYSSRVPSIAYSMPLTSDQVGSTGAWAVVGNSYHAIPGSYVYSPDVGTVLPLGTHTLQVTFLPTDTVNFNPVVATATITVNNSSVVASSDITLTPSGSLVYSGTAKAFSASSTGISGFTYSYSGRGGTSYGPSSTAPTFAGSYTVTATVNDPFAIGTKSVDFVIARAVPTISRNPTASTLTFGQTLAAANLFGGVASVPGTFTFAAPSTVLNEGTSSQAVVFTPTDTANYTTTTGTASVTVYPLTIAAGAFTFSPPGTLVYNGLPKPYTATAAGPGGTLSNMIYSYTGVSGTTYGPSVTAPTNPGSYSVTAALWTSNYVGSATQAFTITKAPVPPSDITLTPPESLTYSGTAKSFAASSAGIAGFTFSYSGRDGTAYGPSSTAPTYAGSYTVTATVNDPLFAGTKSLDFVIAKIVPTITTNPSIWPLLTYGQALSATRLRDGVASVPGTFAFENPATVLDAGTYWQRVVFTPTDTVNCTTAIGSALVYVFSQTIAAGAFTFTPPGSLVYDGSPKSFAATAAGPAGTLSAMSYSYAGIGGTTYGPSATAPTNAGSYSVTATLAGGNFTGSATQTFTIAKVTPAINWATPASITYYTALSATQLNATANVDGAFSYTPAAGTVLGVGAHVLQAVFTPHDTTNYATVTASVPLQVTSPQLPIALRASPNLTYDGTAKPYAVSQNAYLAAGREHAIALKADGTVVAWGRNNAGQATVPSGLTGVVQVAAGYEYSAVVKANGTVVTWGSSAITTFTNLNLVTNAVAAAAGNFFIAVLRADGTVTTFGLVYNTQTLIVPAGLSGVTAIAAGDDHVLALKNDGTVVAWGRNSSGQATVPAGLSNVVAVAASGTHSLALKADGTVVAWGDNSMGQGNVPSGLSGVVAITAGSSNSYALKADGTVVGWGYDYTRVVPANVTGVAALAAGGQHAFAINTDGTVTAWGRILNHSGSDQSDAAPFVPSPLSGVGNFSFSYSYAGRAGTTYPATTSAPTNAGNYTLTVSSALAEYSYGKTLDFTIAKATPTITTLPQVSLITEGQPLSAAILNDGVASVPGTFAFREASFVPSAGVTTQEITFTPTDAINYRTVITTVTVRSQGTNAAIPDILSLPTAGSIRFGQRLQDSALSGGAASVPGTFVFSSALTTPNPGTARQSVTFIPADIVSYAAVTLFVPLTVTDGIISPLNIALIPPASLAYDGAPKAFRTSRGSLLSASNSGYLLVAKSDGTVGGYPTHASTPPLSIPAGLAGVVAVSAGSGSYRALKSDGTLAEWGSTWQGAAPAGLSGVVAITSGTYHSLALKSDGTVVAWGENYYGQRNVPAGLSNVVAIAASSSTSFALKSDGTVVAWGSNQNGQCDVPVGLSGVIAISVGNNGTIAALKSDGTVVSWGRNVDFSNNVTGQATVPAGLNNVVALAVGDWHTAALKADGTVVSWGLGTDLVRLDTRNIVPHNLSGVVALSAGHNKTYALRSDGSVVWWGQGGYTDYYYVDGRQYVLTEGPYAGYSVTAPSIMPLLAADSAGFAFSAAYAGRDGTSYALSATPPTNPGDYSVTVIGTDPDFVATKTIDFSIAKALPTITAVPVATGITYGQTLAVSSLSGGSASVDGAFAFAAPTTVPNAGTHSQSVVFTPSDTSVYGPLTVSVPVTVARLTPTLVTLPTATSVIYGQTLASSELANGLATVPGTFSFTSSSTVPDAGSSSHGITFTPADSVNYDSFTASVNVFVTGGPPTITAPPTATSIRYGQNLAYSALSGGIASVPGTFAFADESLVPASGTANQNVVFTPTDTENYTPVTLAVAVRVRSFDTADDAGTAGEATGLANGTAGLDAVGNVLDSDTNYDMSGLTVTGIASSHGAGTIGTPLVGSYGTLTMLPGGNYVYVVDNANATVQALAPGATLVESFTYSVASATDTASATLRITIYGGNDGPSLTAIPVAVTSVNEDTEAELTFAAIAAAGDESDVDGLITAFVVRSVPSGTLRIGASVGTATPWDAATNAAITADLKGYWMPAANASGTIVALTVVARDDGGLESPLAVEGLVTVLDVNDQPTDIALTANAAAENAPIGTAAGTLSSADADAGETFTYSLVSGAGDTDNAAFTIDGNTLETATRFDFEAKNIYAVRIRSTDANGLFTEKAFTISVTNLNEAPSDIGLVGSAVAENAASGAAIGTLFTIDADASDSFTYVLVSGAGDTDNAAFTIEGSTLKTSGVFDFETKSNYSVRVRSIDAGGLFTEKTLTILVTDVNETPSDIGLTSDTVAENAPSDTRVGTLSTTDVDAGDIFTFSLVSGAGDTHNTAFTIDGNSLKTSAAFDFEAASSYTVRVRSTDAGGLFTEKALTILVVDVNETPSDISLTTSNVAENAPIGTAVGTLSSADADAGDTFTYSLVSGTGDANNALFALDEGTLRTAVSFNFEVRSSYTVRVRSTDAGGLFTEKSFIILVTDVNETPSDISLTVNTVAENASIGTSIGTLSTADVDAGDTFTYSLVSGTGDTDNAAFSIDNATLRTAAGFNFEAKSSYAIRVRSTDAGGSFTEKSFTILVADVNETPSDIGLSADTVAENASSGTSIGTLTTTDVDAGDTFVYALVAGTGDTDNAAFTIDGSTLKSAASFDFETQASFTVRVRSSDSNGLFTEKPFTITVTNVYEAPTDITLSGSTVVENTASGASVGTLSTADVDAGDTFTYTLVSGDGDTDNAFFAIDGGVVKTSAVFNFEVKNAYSVRVRSTDANGLLTEKSFAITVTNVNEAPADITLTGSTVAENAASGSSVGTLSTTDVDAADTFTYTLVAGAGDTDNASFTIDGSTLKTNAVFNFEAKNAYTVRVRSTDANGLFTEKTFAITVTNVNEGPTDITLTGSTVAENATSGTTVGSLTTTDVDAADTFTYTLVAGTGDADNAAFTIDGSTLKTAASFDFETRSSYTFRVRSTDSSGLTTEKPFTVSVTNVNEAPTDITLTGSSVAENTASGTTVGSLTTTDVDAADTFTYTLVAGTGDTDNAAFMIDGGVLKTAASFDFEAKGSYTVRVRSSDANGLFAEKLIAITVTNVNEGPTDITLTGSTVAENATSGTTVGSLTTTDVDAADTFTYTLVAGVGDTDNASFTIDGSTLKTAASFDFETKSSYTVRVHSTDADGLSVEKVFTIMVTNVNEAPTDITLTGSVVAENAASGTTVGTLSTTDVDAADTFTYTLVAGTGDTDNASFTIDGSTLKTAALFDFETKDSYTVRVRSADANGLTTEKPFTVSVTNVNEAPTDITLTGSVVAENAASGTTVGWLTTTDVDAADTFTYTLVADTDNAAFAIDGSTLKTGASFDFETKSSYTVRVRSTDANGLTIEKPFTVSVTNVNEGPTDITLTGSSVAENTASGTTIGSLTTTDVDAGETFTYTLVAGTGDTDNAAFTIDGSTLKTAASFDFETKGSYTVRVRSTDSNGLFTEKSFAITVTNVNEAPTDITLTGSTVAENSSSGTTVGSLTTSDFDAGDTFTHTLVSGSGDTDNVFFTIDGGTLKTAASFDFEVKNAYSVRVRSTDANGLFTEKSFGITVTNVNEPATIGLPDPFLNEVVEDVAVNVAGFLSTTGTFSVVDPDAGESTFATTVAVPVDQSNLGEFSVAVDGAYVYSVRNSLAAVQAIRAGETVIDRFLVRSADGTTRLVSFRIAGASDTLAGAVADGYLRNARVFADANANGQLDWADAGSLNGTWDAGEGEAWTTTDNAGNFSFDFGSPTARLVTVGGIDISTNLPFVGSLQAPAGSTIINPLTTLVAATLAHDTTMSVTDAAAVVAAALGLPQAIDLTTYDPLAQAAGDPMALVVQKAAAGVANVIVATVTNGIDTDAALANLAELVTASNSGPVNLQDSSVLASVLTVETGGQPTAPPATLVAGLVLVNTAIASSQSLTEIAQSQTLVQGGTPFTSPAITSSATAGFATREPGSFQFTASGYPAPTFSIGGSLPAGLTLTSGGLLAGTPAQGTAGSYAFTVTAGNGIAPAATQAFTLTVAQSDDVAVSVDQSQRVVLSLAPRGVTITDLHTAYDARRRVLTIKVAGPSTMSGGAAGVAVDAAGRTVTVRLDVFPGFAGLAINGNAGADSITIGRRGVDLNAVTRGAASQSFSIDTATGSGDGIIVGGPITAKAAGAVSLTTLGRGGTGGIHLAAPVRTPSGSQSYAGAVTLVGNLALNAGGNVAFGGTVDGRRSLALAAGGGIAFAAAVGSTAPLTGLTVSRAASVAVSDGLDLDGTGTRPGTSGLTIGSRVNNVVFAALGAASRTIENFPDAGIRFLGGSTGSVITGITSRRNGIGVSMAEGDYRGTQVTASSFEANRRLGVLLEGTRNLRFGGANSGASVLGNRVTGRLLTGHESSGVVIRGRGFGTLVQGNSIGYHLGDGMRLVDARGVTIGGAAPGVGNTISVNLGAGLRAMGDCSGSIAVGNTVGRNLRGNGEPPSLRGRA